MKKYLTAIVAITLAGCATRGNEFDITKVNGMKPGVTTLETAKAELGQPVAITAGEDGKQIVRWFYAKANFLGMASAARLDLVFDRDGKMVGISHSAKVN